MIATTSNPSFIPKHHKSTMIHSDPLSIGKYSNLFIVGFAWTAETADSYVHGAEGPQGEKDIGASIQGHGKSGQSKQKTKRRHGTLFPANHKYVWSGPRALVQREGSRRRSCIDAAIEILMKYEAKLVEGIVNDVLIKFSDMSKGDDSYDRNLIGIKLRVEEVEREPKMLRPYRFVLVGEPLENLKLMDLSHTCGLERIPNLSSIAPNVEFLDLNGCESLVEIPSLQNLSKLTQLYLTGPNKIKDCPEIPCNIRFLNLDYTGIEQLPSSIKHLSQLVTLSLDRCTALESLPSSIGNLKRLEELDLSECSRLVTIPSSIGELKCLENNCVKLNKKVMEDVFEAHLLGQKVTLLMAGGEVPERMRYKNKGSSLSFKLDLRHVIAFSFCVVLRPRGGFYFDRFEVDFICESGNRRERKEFKLFSDKVLANWNGYYAAPYLSDSSHVLLSFNGLRTRFDEESFVKASFCFIAKCPLDRPEIMECGVHPIYSRDKRRSRNEKHQDDMECQSLLQILEDKSKRRRI
ncbi:hypothetical protein GH714_022322 [Hevea brasiliensis]|uniref:Disease resistance R13L4/SHOC-2-like LRR domain-containing protein n=1 Tax=Hevea brasiliensis TaxID=3981 RepID=A0A6A6N3Z4_HEVBR|nr:hypothetical protein GH714_022322 [Hevea brasiliensis]